MKRAARLVALTEHMRGRKTGVTAEALAERFGVSVRTMYRDLETLQDATLPIRAERGRGGGYALDRDYFLPPVALSPAEAALCVLLIEHAIAMRQVPFTDTMHAALAGGVVGVGAAGAVDAHSDPALHWCAGVAICTGGSACHRGCVLLGPHRHPRLCRRQRATSATRAPAQRGDGGLVDVVERHRHRRRRRTSTAPRSSDRCSHR